MNKAGMGPLISEMDCLSFSTVPFTLALIETMAQVKNRTIATVQIFGVPEELCKGSS
jgi:predicted ThiF/HesA family dinucleotide-utilizing enzyme